MSLALGCAENGFSRLQTGGRFNNGLHFSCVLQWTPVGQAKKGVHTA
jgi:hypothetical protein